MKQLYARLLVIAVLGTLLATAGCVLNGTDVVVTGDVCVDISEVQTTGTFSSFVVTDEFKEAFDKKLKENGKTTIDVKSIHMVSATFKTTLVKPHDWNVTANIDIARQDTPGGAYDDGPAPLVSFNNQSLKALKGSPTDATLDAAGVALVDRALASLVAGQDPRLVLIVNNENVSPTPSTSDPMEFKVRTCVTFQAVVNGSRSSQ